MRVYLLPFTFYNDPDCVFAVLLAVVTAKFPHSGTIKFLLLLLLSTGLYLLLPGFGGLQPPEP